MNVTLARREKLAASLQPLAADAILVTDRQNVRYLTGFTGSAGYLLVSPTNQILLSDPRYTAQLAHECPDLAVDIRDVSTSLIDSVKRIIAGDPIQRLAVEAHQISKADYDQLDRALPSTELVDTENIVEEFRSIKDVGEIQLIKRSIAVNQIAFQRTVDSVSRDQTEREFAYRLEQEMRTLGASGFAFEPVVAVGQRSALPHGRPTDVPLGNGDCFLVDWGADVDGYLSDLTRMVFTQEPTDKLADIYQIVLRSQQAAIAAVGPGVSAAAVDAAARNVIVEAGFGDFFGHGTGHSLGLQIHELPFLTPSSDCILQAGMVLTIEPGIYIPEFAGFRIEDDVLVTHNGCEILSNLPKELEQCSVRLGGN